MKTILASLLCCLALALPRAARADDDGDREGLARVVVSMTFSRADWRSTTDALVVQFAPVLQSDANAMLDYETFYEAQVDLYRSQFTSAELQKIIRYYRSREGQRSLAALRRVETTASSLSLPDDLTEMPTAAERVPVQVKLPAAPRPRPVPVRPSR